MRVFSSGISAKAASILITIAACAFLAVSTLGQSQATAADLSGSVTDPTGAVVAGATVRAKGIGNGINRTVTANAEGNYQFIGLPAGDYEITAEAATFKKVVISPVRLTVGQSADLTIKLEVGAASAVVNVTGDDVQLVETTKSTVSNTIGQQSIENLPINERSATGFALTLSTVGRDNGRPIGPAPTSGLNIGGQSGRSTQVNVDGADFTDNSINAARSTVSMEAVQEYQVATNSYNAEFGRATGGIVNVVTKRGTNDFRGNVFGFLRDKRIQARNAFAPVADPDFRRTQFGATFGGPIVKDKTHFFMAYEGRRRDESGFFTSNVASGLISASYTITGLGTQTFSGITPAQKAYVDALLGSGNGALINAGVQYLYLASSGGTTALTGTNPLISPGGAIPVGSVVGQRFFLSGAPVPNGTIGTNGLPIAFRALNSLDKIFPVTDRSNFFTTRVDQNINSNNQLNFRFGYNTSKVTGIQVESQNQSLGQNDFSRTGISDLKDLSFNTALNTVLNSNMANEFRYSFGQRKAAFRSQNGEAVAFNIAGTAFIGRELFSPVDRIERRHQFVDNFNWVVGNHTMKFGGDFNFVSIPRAHFELNYAALFNFGNTAATNLAAFPAFGGLTAPDFTPVQSYGLGMPSQYLQGFGNPDSKIKNKPIAFYLQDSWRATRKLTINYGLRYDIELTETIAPVGITDPLTGIVLSASDIQIAQDAVGVQQGIPRDKNNWAPRLGFAYDVFGSGKTVVRGSIGLYYDHPLLTLAFNSDVADASQQQQAVLTAGSPIPSNTTLLNAALVFQGTVCGNSGSNAALCAGFGSPTTPGVASTAQYQFGRMRFNDQFYTGFGAVLPFSLPVTKDFQYASATQANFAVEQQIGRNMSLSASFIFVGSHHLLHPTDLNTPNTALQIQNYQRYNGGALPTSTQQVLTLAIATTLPGTPTGVGCTVVIPGMVAQCPGGRVVAPAIANFFRPNAPNYFLARALGGPALTKAALDAQLVGSLRTPGAITPYGTVNGYASNGNSEYKGLNIELKRRFSNNFAFLASYTLSHSIDDSSDLQTLLAPQDNTNFKAERSDALFDQRHRFVFSGMWMSPTAWRTGDGWHRFLSDWTVAPIIELSSGRPFNIITDVDANNDQSSQTDRPSVNADGTLCVPGTTGCITPLITDGRFSTGNLGRNAGITRGFFSMDMRISRAIRFGERFRLDLIAEGFNLFNRFNEGSVTPFYLDVNAVGKRSGSGKYYSRPTAAYDSRQFQFGAKFSF